MQFFERTLDDSANRRLVIPESFLATDAILMLMENIASGLEVHPARIRRRSRDELPFMATEELIVRAVRAGGDRQVAHERIRQHSIEAARAMKNGATRNDMLDRLADGSALRRVGRRPGVGARSAALRRPRAAAGRRVSRRRRRAVARRTRRGDRPARRGSRMTIAQLEPLPLQHLRRGKVREVYIVDDDRLLLVATDRVSAFDVVMAEPIPYKGAVLTQITAWWLRQLEGDVRHHMLSSDVDEIIDAVPSLADHRAALAGRAMLCRRTEVFPIECVIRGYLSGSAWKEYQRERDAGRRIACRRVCARASVSIRRSSARRRKPSRATMRTSRSRGSSTTLGPDVAAELERLSRLVYERGRAIAAERGIIIADTKFEFGRDRDGAHHADRRSAHARQLALLARRAIRAGPLAAELRQAAAARLSRRRATRRPLERRRAAAAACRETVVSRDERAIPRRVPPNHRRASSIVTELS